MVKTCASNAGGMSLDSGQGTKIPSAEWHGKKKTTPKNQNNHPFQTLSPCSLGGMPHPAQRWGHADLQKRSHREAGRLQASLQP